MATVNKPRVGGEAWFVEWCAKIAYYDDGTTIDRDECKMVTRKVATREEAQRVAAEKYPQDELGEVCFWPARFVAYDEDDAERLPHAGFWETTDEPEYYEGEES